MKDPAALLYIDTWLTATAEMDADVRGWYLNLVLHQYDKGDLPNDIEKLATLAMVRFSEFPRFEQVFEQVLKQKFELQENGRLKNPFAAEIIRKRETFIEKRTAAGVIGYVVKVANELKATPAEVEHLKNTLDFDTLDIKNKQMLKQMLTQLLKLYKNGNGNGNKQEEEPDWKKSYDVYLKEVSRVYHQLVEDKDYIREQERFNPGLDIPLSLEKAFVNYWGTQNVWQQKRQSGAVTLDLKAIFTNAIPLNKVYKQNDGQAKRGFESKPETALRIAQSNMESLRQRIADSERGT